MTKLPVVCAALLFVAQNAVGFLDTPEPNQVGRLAGVRMGAENQPSVGTSDSRLVIFLREASSQI